MEPWMWTVIIVAFVLVIGLVAWVMTRRSRTDDLRRSFGPEYDVALSEADTRREAESELQARRERREQLQIHALTPEARDRFSSAWRETQARFVDSPRVALAEADLLVLDLMRERGYPAADFEQRSADVSVDHPDVVRNYRAAHAISMEAASDDVDTERMRQGLVHFRALFDELLRDETIEADRRVG
ncbi:MAG TPA: hypothetical protein VFK59_00055 [Actinomycetota bacterium]|jgi:hypothetical protein|nr:hypothetical protein [Actinomycetota bacterium]